MNGTREKKGKDIRQREQDENIDRRESRLRIDRPPLSEIAKIFGSGLWRGKID